MELAKHTLENNVQLLKSKVSKHALYGLIISVCSIVVATLIVALNMAGEITIDSVIGAQKSNVAIWVLDASPFLFSFWGQLVSSAISYQAGTMVFDQTNDLRMQTTALESKVLHESLHDALTELPNRILLVDRLTQALTVARTDKKALAIFMIDINRFKEINDALGHHNGDRLLKQIAARLQSVVQEPNSTARLGGDEFAILMPHVNAAKDAIVYARKIQKSLETTFALEGITLDLHAAIGIALYPEHGSDPDTLLQRADVAMYACKQNKSDFTIYSPKLDKSSPHKLILMGELRRAIDNNDLVCYYQPKVDMHTGKVLAAEVLIRWDHERFSLMQPDDFIPLAERTGLIRPLTQWVLNRSLKQCALWHQAGLKIGIAVNLSTVDILDMELPDTIAGLLAAHDLNPRWLKLELTESAFMNDQHRSLEILNRLSEMGVSLSIDDFGTGYSSLSYLSKLPVNEVKIDKSFVMNMNKNREDAVIVRATIDLAHNLNLQVVAEGVTEKEIYEDLVKLGCDLGQGFYISRPKDAKDFIAWLRTLDKNNPEVAHVFRHCDVVNDENKDSGEEDSTATG